MNIIKGLFECCFIGKIYDITVVVGAQYRPVCVFHSSRVAGKFVCDTPGYQDLSSMLVHTTHSQGIMCI